MIVKTNAFTAGPTLTWASKPPKRPNLNPRNIGLHLEGSSMTLAERGARGALIEAKKQMMDKYARRIGRK